MLWSLNRLFCSLVLNSLSSYSSNLHLPLCVLACLSLFVSLGKSRQWDPWLQRPSCHSKSQSHLWHWAPRSYYLWTFVHHLPGRERGETRECGRGKHTDRMRLFLHVCHLYAHTSTEKYALKWASVLLSFPPVGFSTWKGTKKKYLCTQRSLHCWWWKAFIVYWTSVSLTAPHCQEGAFPLARWQGEMRHRLLMMINDPKWAKKREHVRRRCTACKNVADQQIVCSQSW